MANKKLNAIIQIGGGISSSLKGAFGTLKSNLGSVGKSLADLNRRQRDLNKAVNRYGQEGRALSGLRREYENNAKSINILTAAQQRLNRAQAGRNDTRARGDELKGKILGTAAAVYSVAFPIRAAMEFESTMADIKKVVNPPEGANAENFFTGIRKNIIDLSTQIPMTANQLGQIYAAAGQSGIATQDLQQFVTTAAKMGVAFDISAEQAGQSLAEMKAAFGMTLPQVTVLADKINYLGNNTAASAANIMEIVQRVGPLGGVANVASGEIAALGATLRGMGVQNEIAATGIKNLMLSLTAGDAATKSQRAAMKQLGYTSKHVAKSMQLDSTQTMLVILKRIKQMNKVDQSAIITKLFGKEVAGSIAPLITQLDALEANIISVGKGNLYAGSMQKEFDARAATTANSVILLKNRLQGMAVTIGYSVLPLFNDLVQATFPYMDGLSRLITQHPELTKKILITAAALASLRVVTLAGAFAWNGIRGAVFGAYGAFARIAAGIARARVAMIGFNIAAVANPVGATIAIIALAIGALSLAIYRNWDVIKAWVSGALTPLWEGIKPVREAFSALGGMIKRVGEDMGITSENIGGLITWFKNLFTPVTAGADSLKSATSAGQEFGSEMAKAINAVLSPLTTLIDSFKWLDNNFTGIMNKAQTFGHDTIKGWWNKGKQFVMGNDPDPSERAGWSPSYGAPPPPAMAGNKGGGYHYTDQSTNTFQIQQRQGETPEAFARRLADIQEQQRLTRQRSQMPDGVSIP